MFCVNVFSSRRQCLVALYNLRKLERMSLNEPRHDKTNKVTVRPAKAQVSLGTQSDQSSLCAWWVAKDPNFPHADSEDSDQTGRMPRLIWVFAGRTLILFVLSCRGSNTQIPLPDPNDPDRSLQVQNKKLKRFCSLTWCRWIWIHVHNRFRKAQTYKMHFADPWRS